MPQTPQQKICSIVQPLYTEWRVLIEQLDAAFIEAEREGTAESIQTVEALLLRSQKAQEAYEAKASERHEYAGDSIQLRDILIVQAIAVQLEEGVLQDRIEIDNSGRIIKLSLSNTGVREIPDSLPSSLQYLSLDNTEVREIPESLLSSLQVLSLYNTGVREIPESLPSSLQYLSLDNTEVRKIPDSLPSSLQQLYLSHTGVSVIPDNLPSSLQELYLVDTPVAAHLRADPAEFTALKQKYPNCNIYI